MRSGEMEIIMIKAQKDRCPDIEMCAENGVGKLTLDRLLTQNEKIQMFSKATLEVGASVGYHQHVGNAECYYILKGKAEYDGDGEISVLTEGHVTYTPDGHSHGIKNIGDEPLEFIALIIKN